MSRRVVRSRAFIALLGALLLCACGDSSGQESGSRETVDGSVEARQETGAQEFVWEIRTVEPPSFGAMTVREQPITEEVSVKLATTPFGYDFEEMEQIIRASSFITDRYKLRNSTGERINDAESYQEGDFHDYHMNWTLDGEWKDSSEEARYDDFIFNAGIDYGNYENINTLYFTFDGIPGEKGLQENIYTLLADTLGEGPAQYLVYAESEGAKNHELEEYINLPDGVCYYFKREMKEGSEEGTWYLRFVMWVDYPGFMNRFVCYDGGMTPMLANAKYDLGFFTEGKVSGWDLEHFSTDMPEYNSIDMGNKFIRNTLGYTVYEESLSDDGVTTYWLANLKYTQGLENVPAFECPVVDMEYEIREQAGEMISLEICFKGENIGDHFDDSDEDSLHERVLSIMREQIGLMCPWLDLGETGYDQLMQTKSMRDHISVNCLGMECECTVYVKLTGAAGEWMVDVSSVKPE